MSDKCIATTESGRCKNKAAYQVSKRNDLSHRVAEYCNEHTTPYRFYEDDFKIEQLKR